MEWVGVAVFSVAFVAAVALCPLVRRLSQAWGFLDRPGPRKLQPRPVPRGGGVALLVGWLVPIAGGLAVAYFAESLGIARALPEELRIHLAGMRSAAPRLAVLLGAAVLIFAAGLWDDLRGLSARRKLVLQLAIAIGLVMFGFRMQVFPPQSSAWPDVVLQVLTVAWIVLITNAFNLLDNMDGLCAGIAVVVCVMFLLIALQSGQIFIALALAALLGSCLGFLLFNFPPASIYMGDAGSQLLGFLLSTLTVLFSFYEYRPEYPTYALLVPLLILLVPLFDTCSVVLIRLRRGQPIFQGDRSHFSHRLQALGLSARQALVVNYLLTMSAGLSALLLHWTDAQGSLLVTGQILAVLLILVILEGPARGAVH